MKTHFNNGVRTRISVEDLQQINDGCIDIIMQSASIPVANKIMISHKLQQLYHIQKGLIEDGEDIEMSAYLNIMQLANINCKLN
jgi:hypothetical protein